MKLENSKFIKISFKLCVRRNKSGGQTKTGGIIYLDFTICLLHRDPKTNNLLILLTNNWQNITVFNTRLKLNISSVIMDSSCCNLSSGC